jgi:hypothetical protein
LPSSRRERSWPCSPRGSSPGAFSRSRAGADPSSSFQFSGRHPGSSWCPGGACSAFWCPGCAFNSFSRPGPQRAARSGDRGPAGSRPSRGTWWAHDRAVSGWPRRRGHQERPGQPGVRRGRTAPCGWARPDPGHAGEQAGANGDLRSRRSDASSIATLRNPATPG